MKTSRTVRVDKRAQSPNRDVKPELAPETAKPAPKILELASRPVVKWPVLALIALFCVYRIATFTPRAIDSPDTLRPGLYGWIASSLTSAQQIEGATSDWTLYCFITLFIAVGLAVWNYYRNNANRPPQVIQSRWLFLASVALFLFVCRFPLLLLPEMNPDETQFIASANKLFHDPVFFRSVDCGTVGPLDVMPLMLPAVLGYSPDYASSRAIGLIILFLGIYFLYRTFALLTREDVARIAVLPVAGAFAILKVPDLIHYSSEHVPALLTAIGLYLCVRVLVEPGRSALQFFLLGLLAMAAFFAKMQAVPMIAVSGAVAFANVQLTGAARPVWKPAVMIIAGLLPLWIINAIICAAGGVWHDFWLTYIAGNIHYTDSGIAATFRPAAQTLQDSFTTYIVRHAELRWLFLTALAIIAAGMYRATRRETPANSSLLLTMGAICGAVLFAGTFLANSGFSGLLVVLIVPLGLVFWYLTRKVDVPAVGWFGLGAVLLVAATIFSIYAAHNHFTHYLLLLIVPLGTAMAWPAIRSHGAALLTLLVGVSLAWESYQLINGNPKVLPVIPPSVRSPESDLVSSLTKPGEQITIWGWNARPYLGAGRLPATRDTNMTNFFRPPREISEYHRARFLQDARRNPPVLFIDAVGVTGSREMTDRKIFGYDVFPDVKEFVGSNYVFLYEFNGERFFIRKDLISRAAAAHS